MRASPGRGSGDGGNAEDMTESAKSPSASSSLGALEQLFGGAMKVGFSRSFLTNLWCLR
jgi:hypothetical protein